MSSIKGPKGHMGWKGGVGMPPDWIRAIIKFRNKKYDEDIARKGWVIVDEDFKEIDEAISELHKLY